MWVQPGSVSGPLGAGGRCSRGRLASSWRSPACLWAPACCPWLWGRRGHCLSQGSGR